MMDKSKKKNRKKWIAGLIAIIAVAAGIVQVVSYFESKAGNGALKETKSENKVSFSDSAAGNTNVFQKTHGNNSPNINVNTLNINPNDSVKGK